MKAAHPSKVRTILLIITGLSFLACQKEELRVKCLPNTITEMHHLISILPEEYIYENDTLVQYGLYKLIYQNGLVTRINAGDYYYENYLYNNQNQIIKSIQFRKKNSNSDFAIFKEHEYKYAEDRIVEIIDKKENTKKLISYSPGSNNIDSIKTVGGNDVLIELSVFKYDEANTPFRSLPTPRFNYSYWVERVSQNNIIQEGITRYNEPLTTLVWNYDIDYNEFDYPTTIIAQRDSSTFDWWELTITYINCK